MKLNVIASFVYITSAFLRLDSGSIHTSIYSHSLTPLILVCLVLVWRKHCVWIFQGNSKTEPFFYSLFVGARRCVYVCLIFITMWVRLDPDSSKCACDSLFFFYLGYWAVAVTAAAVVIIRCDCFVCLYISTFVYCLMLSNWRMSNIAFLRSSSMSVEYQSLERSICVTETTVSIAKTYYLFGIVNFDRFSCFMSME